MTPTQIKAIQKAVDNLNTVSIQLNDTGRAFSKTGNTLIACELYTLSEKIDAAQRSIVNILKKAHPSMEDLK